jgi:hypothetical protein
MTRSSVLSLSLPLVFPALTGLRLVVSFRLRTFLTCLNELTYFGIASEQTAAVRNTKGGSITVPLTSCLTGLELAV